MVGRVKCLSSCLLDVFPASECYEAELGRVERRSTVDCYAMEAAQVLSKKLLVAPSLATLSLATAEVLKTKEWVMHQLGLFRKEVDQALVGLIAGLEVKPKGVQNRAGSVHGLANGSAHGPIHGSDIGLDPNLDSDPGSDLGFFIAIGSDLSDPLPVASSPGLSVHNTSLGSGIHRELGFATAVRGDRASF
jgi:hypothetical protein